MTFPRLIKKSRGPPRVLKLFIRQIGAAHVTLFLFGAGYHAVRDEDATISRIALAPSVIPASFQCPSIL